MAVNPEENITLGDETKDYWPDLIKKLFGIN